MKFGMRKPSLKKSFKARTTGRVKRAVKSSFNPLYGKKGMGLINNPKKAVYNKVYNKTTVGLSDYLYSNKRVSKDEKESAVSISLEDVKKMNNIQKTELYHLISTQYQPFYHQYYENMQTAKENYSLFIKDPDNKYLQVIENCYEENEKMIETYRNLEQITNETTGGKDIALYNDCFTYLVKAYERAKMYDKAIYICNKAIECNFTNFDRNTTFQERIEYIRKKQSKEGK